MAPIGLCAGIKAIGGVLREAHQELLQDQIIVLSGLLIVGVIIILVQGIRVAHAGWLFNEHHVGNLQQPKEKLMG